MFVEKRFGRDAVQTCLESLTPDDRKVLATALPVNWVPIEPSLRFMRTADKLFGAGDLGLCRELGAFSADWQLNSFHKLFLHFQKPSYLVERATQVWGNYHDTGAWRIETPGPTTFEGTLEGFVVPADESFALRLEGWLARAFSLCGAKGVVVKSQIDRDAYRYQGSWD